MQNKLFLDIMIHIMFQTNGTIDGHSFCNNLSYSIYYLRHLNFSRFKLRLTI